jgi:hypothetical protein
VFRASAVHPPGSPDGILEEKVTDSMTNSACPYCYQQVNLKVLKFQCNGQSAPGRSPCVPLDPTSQPDARRLQLTGYAEPYRPSFLSGKTGMFSNDLTGCPRCGAPARIRVCPECETPLPSDFFSSTSPLFGLVGAKYSGKSVYLAVLNSHLRQRTARRFDASITVAADGGGNKDVAQNYEKMFGGDRVLPPATAANRGKRYGRQPFVLRWTQKSSSGKLGSVLLSFFDSAGEDLGSADSINEQEYLGASQGLIVLIDPFQLPGNRDLGRSKLQGAGDVDAMIEHDAIDTLSRITEYLRMTHRVKTSKKVPIPLAVCFTKIDAFFDRLDNNHPLRMPAPKEPYYDEVEGESLHEHLKSLLTDWEGDDILRHLELSYQKFRLFGVSALGAEPDYRTQKVNSQGIRPFRVDDPILWLLAERGFVAKRKG